MLIRRSRGDVETLLRSDVEMATLQSATFCFHSSLFTPHQNACAKKRPFDDLTGATTAFSGTKMTE